MSIQEFIARLEQDPESIEFNQTIDVIEASYMFTPVSFDNGDVHNSAGQNSGSCKIFAFALLHQLSKAQTLACFGQYYRNDVLQNPNGDDHSNIRNFIKHGWNGISFANSALALNDG